MALANVPATFAGAVVAVPGTSIAPTNPIPENCHTILILNVSNFDGLWGIAAPGAGTLTERVNASRIPAQSELRLPLGTVSERGIMDQAQVAGSGIVYVDTGAGLPTFDITYLNVLGEPV